MSENRGFVSEALARRAPPAPEGTWTHAVRAAADAFDILCVAGDRTMYGGDHITNLQHHLAQQEVRSNGEPALRAGLDELHRLMRVLKLPFSVVLEESICGVEVIGGKTFDETAIQQTLVRILTMVKRQKSAQHRQQRDEVGTDQSALHEEPRPARVDLAPSIRNTEQRSGFFLPDISILQNCRCGDHLAILGSHEFKALADRSSIDRAMRRIEAIYKLRAARNLLSETPRTENWINYVMFSTSSRALAELRSLGEATFVSRIDNMHLPAGLSFDSAPATRQDGASRVDWNSVRFPEDAKARIRNAIQDEDARLKARTGIAQEVCYLLAHAEACGGAHGIVTIGTMFTTLIATGPSSVAVALDGAEQTLAPAALFNDPSLFFRLPHQLTANGTLNLRAFQVMLDQYAAMALAVGPRPTQDCPSKLSLPSFTSAAHVRAATHLSIDNDSSRGDVISTARPELASSSQALQETGDGRPPKRRKALVDPLAQVRYPEDEDRGTGGSGSSHRSSATFSGIGGAASSPRVVSAQEASSSSAQHQAGSSTRSHLLPTGTPIMLPPGDVDALAATHDDDLLLGDEAPTLAIRPSDDQLQLLFGLQPYDMDAEVDESERDSALGDFLIWVLESHGVQIQVVTPSTMERLVRQAAGISVNQAAESGAEASPPVPQTMGQVYRETASTGPDVTVRGSEDDRQDHVPLDRAADRSISSDSASKPASLVPIPQSRRRSPSTAPSSAPSLVRAGTSSSGRATASPETVGETAEEDPAPISRKHARDDEEDCDIESATT